jgi:hypothetical protein
MHLLCLHTCPFPDSALPMAEHYILMFTTYVDSSKCFHFHLAASSIKEGKRKDANVEGSTQFRRNATVQPDGNNARSWGNGEEYRAHEGPLSLPLCVSSCVFVCAFHRRQIICSYCPFVSTVRRLLQTHKDTHKHAKTMTRAPGAAPWFHSRKAVARIL